MTSQERIAQWLQPPFDQETQQNVKALHQYPDQLEDAFYTQLEFGTGGMRGIMGVGTNRINKYTLGKNTQGLSQYLINTYPNEKIKVVVAYDCRHQSQELARICASIFTANGIYCYFFRELRPTPELSFAVRHLKAHAGIVLTASHNPPEYNGYKVYGIDGGQLVPPQDKQISKLIDQTSFDSIKFEGNKNLLNVIDTEIDLPYRETCLRLACQSFHEKTLKIVFTSIHGTSITALPEVLKSARYQNVYIVEEQAQPNGDFPTVTSPNPEEKEALALAVQKASDLGADIVIGTDPDADRFGLVIRNSKNQWFYPNGNQVLVVLTEYLLNKRKKSGTLTPHDLIATTIVSTPVLEKMAQAYNVQFKTTLTGFKWIGKLIQEFPDLNFIGGGEESFGYLIGDAVRDKDAISASLLACEIAHESKQNGSSFYEMMTQCYQKYGAHKERLVSITKKGKLGAKIIADLMEKYRVNPPKKMGGSAVIKMEDFMKNKSYDLTNQTEIALTYPISNVLKFTLVDKSEISLRPSGTEPKIKFYFSVQAPYEHSKSWEEQEIQLDQKIDFLIKDIVP